MLIYNYWKVRVSSHCFWYKNRFRNGVLETEEKIKDKDCDIEYANK